MTYIHRVSDLDSARLQVAFYAKEIYLPAIPLLAQEKSSEDE